jgi:hypothetical protein
VHGCLNLLKLLLVVFHLLQEDCVCYFCRFQLVLGRVLAVDELIQLFDQLSLSLSSALQQLLPQLTHLGLHNLGPEALDIPLNSPQL